MRFIACVLPLFFLSISSTLATSTPQTELSHTEWLASKTHRMLARARKNHWKHKEIVFDKREKKLRREIRALKKEVENSAATSTKPQLTATVEPAPVLAVTSSHRPLPSSSSSTRPASDKSLSSKKGLGFERLVDLNPLESSISWCYNWGSKLFEPTGSLQGKTQFVPMLWKPDSNHLATWEKDVEYSRSQGGTHLLGFNEPDLGEQANMTIQATLDGWRDHMEPFAKGSSPLKLVSPAITNGAAPMGLTFLEGFMNGAEQAGYTVDAIALHWYDSPTNFEYFKNHLTEAHEKFNKPIWLTEYGFTSGSEQEKMDFHKRMVPWMDSQDWIERYAAFGDFVGTFVDGNGGVLPLGNAYGSS
ncbi:glycoside hydrolase family protein [Sporobolomyces salmoneus]|uniref:glycoside hydrolase family protein n=1 Tax=Sporobolomyces salmoneus TaxID=183962 RepID=UPI00317CEE26